MTTSFTPPPINKEELQISDLDNMVRVLSSWHANQVSILSHMRDIPEGSEAQLDEENLAGTIILTGDVLKAFRLGIELSLNHLGSLPFAIYTEDDGAENSASK